ncbi:MAG: TIGR00159 family protein [bacterium]|nr:TIGR00159 family protein [bacterium]
MNIRLMLGQLNFLEFFYGPLLSGSTSLWVLVVELALIGLPVYAILRFLRGTRGARLVWAVGLILVVSSLVMRLVAREFGFERISYLYPYFVLSVCLIALVVFQPELRRGLMRIGERGWWRSWGKAGQENVDSIVAAVGQLSKKKIGALIAIERTTSLGGVVESGIRLDALVSADLIETVFWPGSALHDMGMIVHGGRIVAAGCQFPLADSEDVDRSLGSRHRAAVGMSHECDAVVVVVSEETGTISVAQHGRLRRSVSPDGLSTLLRETFSLTGPPADGRETPAPAVQPAKSPPPDVPVEAAPTQPAPVQAK